jgi:hypothetical protein
MPGRRIAILEDIQGKGILGERKLLKTDGKGPLGFGVLPSIQERTSKILKR